MLIPGHEMSSEYIGLYGWRFLSRPAVNETNEKLLGYFEKQ